MKTATAPTATLGAAAQRKADQKALREQMKAKGNTAAAKKTAKKAATKTAKPAVKAAKPVAAKKTATKVAKKTVTAPAVKRPTQVAVTAPAVAVPSGTGTGAKPRRMRVDTIVKGMTAPGGSTARILAGSTAILMALEEANREAETQQAQRAAKLEGKTEPGLSAPKGINWAGITQELWQKLTNVEIARLLGCSSVNVHNRRKKLIAETPVKKGEESPFKCQRKAWTRSIDPDKAAAALAERKGLAAKA